MDLGPRTWSAQPCELDADQARVDQRRATARSGPAFTAGEHARRAFRALLAAFPDGVLFEPSLVHCLPPDSQPVSVMRSTPVVRPVTSPLAVLALHVTVLPRSGVSSVTALVVPVNPGPASLSNLPFLGALDLVAQPESAYSPFFCATHAEEAGPGTHSNLPLWSGTPCFSATALQPPSA
jgi:hypothetical protein